jgi:hypothetical protein
MQLELLLPEDLSVKQNTLSDAMPECDRGHLRGIRIEHGDDTLTGLRCGRRSVPRSGASAESLFSELAAKAALSGSAHAVAILVTGARFHARSELYAYERAAARAGLSAAKICAISAGQRPADLSEEEGVAYDVAVALRSTDT